MVACIVPGCTSNGGKRRSVRLFNFPKKQDLLQKWLEAIPGIKPPVKSSWRVCQNHFEPGYILKYFSHTIGGQVYLLKRDRAKLEVDAVPTKNLQPTKDQIATQKPPLKKCKQQATATIVENNGSLELCPHEDFHSRNTPQVIREVLELAEVDQEMQAYDISNTEIPEEVATKANMKIRNDKEVIENGQTQNMYNKNNETTDSTTNHNSETEEEIFESLFDNVFEVVLPSTLWGVHRSTHRNRLMFVCIDEDQLNISKMLIVDDTGNMKMYFKTKLIREERVLPNILTTEHISDTLTELDAMQSS